MTIHVEWAVSRKTDAKDASETTTTQRDIQLPYMVDGMKNPQRQTLLEMLEQQNKNPTPDKPTVGPIKLTSAFPKFLKVTNRITDVVPQLMKGIANSDVDLYLFE